MRASSSWPWFVSQLFCR